MRPYAEDDWHQVSIGPCSFSITGEPPQPSLCLYCHFWAALTCGFGLCLSTDCSSVATLTMVMTSHGCKHNSLLVGGRQLCLLPAPIVCTSLSMLLQDKLLLQEKLQQILVFFQCFQSGSETTLLQRPNASVCYYDLLCLVQDPAHGVRLCARIRRPVKKAAPSRS